MAGMALLAAALAASGCATRQPAAADGAADIAAPADAAATAAARAAAAAAAERELAAGIALYEAGRYVDAIRSLSTAQDLWHAATDMQVTAHKYLAFSHCLLKRPQPCKDSFRNLLALKPDFELAAAEAGHPDWGEAFRQAKREARSPRSPLAGTPR